MSAEINQQAKISRIGGSLEGGLIIDITETHALYQPPLSMHGTFTTSGGFVVTSEFTTKHAIKPFSAYLSFDLQMAYDAEGQDACFYLFLECTEVALQNRGATEAVRGWIKIGETLERRARERPRWRKDAEKCWSAYLESKEAENFLCPCGSSARCEFSTHFRRVHAPWLWSDTLQRPGKRRKIA